MARESAPNGEPASEGIPDFEAASAHVRRELVRFVRRLRAETSVPANASVDAARALAAVGLDDRAQVRAALAASLVSSPDGHQRFEALFPAFWARLRRGLEGAAVAGERTASAPDTDRDPERSHEAASAPTDPPDRSGIDSSDSADDAPVRATTGRREVTDRPPSASGDRERRIYSAAGGREGIDDAATGLTGTERRAVDRFSAALSSVPGRRTRPDAGGAALDARRTLRASLGTGGAPVELPRREAAPTELRCRLLVDVSRSVLDTLDRGVLLSTVYRLHDTALDARTFLFDTDLREVSGAFDRPEGDPVATLRAAETRWGGGTRIGAALGTLRGEHPTAVDRRAVVVVVSDGVDVGEPDRLETGMAWLSRIASAVVWLNPLAKSEDYEPTCRGMATALPYVDGLFAFASPADLAEAARQLERRGPHGPVGYEHDGRHSAGGGRAGD
ncbi:MAG: VWA domain-containing protein [Halobacteriota archaeon]|uniref:VWA domain-containing protein n=1 Tax=Natronomonas sp. TaxID=2184060 RepID=UPI003976815E